MEEIPEESFEKEAHEYESTPLSRQEYISAIVHLYRGEMSRATAWRIRLDTTTNWAVLTTAGLLAFAFRRPFERAPGALFVAYVGLYSLGRFWIEGLRTDSLMAGSLRAAQVASVIGVLLASVGLPLLLRRRRA